MERWLKFQWIYIFAKKVFILYFGIFPLLWVKMSLVESRIGSIYFKGMIYLPFSIGKYEKLKMGCIIMPRLKVNIPCVLPKCVLSKTSLFMRRRFYETEERYFRHEAVRLCSCQWWVLPAVFIMRAVQYAWSRIHIHTFSFSASLLLRNTETLASVHWA